MPAYYLLSPRGDMALVRPPQASGPSKHNSHCTGTCAIVLATVIPGVLLALVLILILVMGENSYLGRRRRHKAENEAVKKKLGDEDSVGSSDVCSLDDDVHGMSEEGRQMASEKTTGEERTDNRREEGHEHDHVLAMIGARP